MQSESSVQFKVFVKLGDEQDTEVRRFGIDKEVVTNFEYLQAKLRNVFPALKNLVFRVTWMDEENDEILISSDDEMMVALSSMPQDIKKLYVKCKPRTEESAPLEEDVPQAMKCPIFMAGFPRPAGSCSGQNASGALNHPGVVCDSCEGPVVGYRYKCVTCSDYDLCSSCEGNKVHPEHFMIRIPVALGPLGHKFERHVGHSIHKSLRKTHALNPEHAFPGRKHRKDRHSVGDIKCPGGDKEEKKEGSPKSGRGRDRRRCSPDKWNQWVKHIASSVNEYVNLAGNFQTEAQNQWQHAHATFAGSSAQAGAQASSQASAGTATGPGNPLSPHVQYLHQIGKQIASMLDPLGIDVDIDVQPKDNQPKETTPQEKPAKEKEAPAPADAAQKETPPPPQPAAEANKIIDIDIDEDDAHSTSSKTADKSASQSPSRTDGWTMLNPEPSAPASSEPQADPHKIGFDLVAEFQKILELERQKVMGQPSGATAPAPTPGIYPNIADAPIPASAPAPGPSSAPVTPMDLGTEELRAVPIVVPQTTSQPQQPRPKDPRIAAALDTMLAMGFKNEGGRLARLLEAKNGNISSVLDVLSMNIP